MNIAYPLIMMLAVTAAAVVSRFTQAQLPIARRDRFLIGLAAFCGAFLAAKLPFLMTGLAAGMRGGVWFSGGKTIMLGLVGGYAGVEFAKAYLRIKTKTGDSFAIPVAVGIGVGRWACLAGGCCYGTPTRLPWGIVFPHVDALSRHPTQIYESIFHLTMAAILFVFYRERVFRGQLMKFYFLSYFAYRFATEFIRPEVRVMLGLTWYQWAAIALTPVFAWLWVRDQRAFTPTSA